MGMHNNLIYSPLMEEEIEHVKSWNKLTVDYAAQNKGKIYGLLRSMSRSMIKRNIQPSDLDDIYSSFLMYLYNCDDYNLDKACENSNGTGYVSFETYLKICLKYCIIRYFSNLNKAEFGRVRDYVSRDGKEVSIFESIPDIRSSEQMEKSWYDLEEICQGSEYKRYRYGPDIYMVWFIRLLTYSAKEDLYKTVLEVLGVGKRDLLGITEKSREDDDDIMLTFATAVQFAGMDKSIKILREYVYGAEIIEKVIREYSCF